ncbi:MAG: hypothetical protein KDD38_00425 [Bdellovibrionales bacterium]|nr:hypothetical protein [Bdellovibrionales bacterium]
MKSIVDLLNEKNLHLDKFYRLNESELEKFNCGEFEGLEVFYSTREGILQIIKKIDEMIEDSNDMVEDVKDVSGQEKKSILQSLQYKKDIVARILEQDLQILSAIEKEKSSIIKELSQVRTTKKALGSYKSGGQKTRLDEEA